MLDNRPKRSYNKHRPIWSYNQKGESSEMRKQKEIGVARFERMLWRQRDGVFYGRQTIFRKPFGEFEVCVQIDSRNGKTSVEVSNYLKDLDWKGEFADFRQAIEGIRKRFTEIDELAKTVKEKEAAIQEECRKVMAKAIAAVLEANRQQESGEVDYE